MLTLVIDSASNLGTVGLVEGDRVLAERRWALTGTYSLELLSTIEAVLTEASVARAALEAVVVDVGPGGYGSLRAGVATAQGLALGLDIPLAGVARLELDAAPHLEGGPPARTVVAVHDAGSSGLAWAAYERGTWPDGPPREVVSPRLGAPLELVAGAPREALWCGELTEALRAALDESGVGWTEAPSPANMPRTLDMSRLAHAHGAFGDPAAVDVFYLRPPAITIRHE
ncbi:MAG: tRNA (adenosine(37)-N6)-threonylcarbamoyltransferase complex dimerization subunit type 1 TsaB [Dehalococcoidia bacterium]|nr:tRNA (adenosine(37)-N6)-threonylcarbamoyltransferase complex dimerization subunit type 1 TsaB [Dehalococcoidia bacterium]